MKSHYNPCFWVALWNREYFQLFRENRETERRAREQKILALNLMSGKLLSTKVEAEHFEKGLTSDEVPSFLAEAYFREFSPADLSRLPGWLQKGGAVPVEFENFFSGIEGLREPRASMYPTLLKVARRGGLESIEEKCALSVFIYFHLARSLPVLSSLVELNKEEKNMPKFLTLGSFKGFLSEPAKFAAAIHRLAQSSWRLYKTDVDMFPLGDTAILGDSRSVLVACSPRLLLEILLDKSGLLTPWSVEDGIGREKHSEYLQRTVNSSFRAILSSDRDTLAALQNTELFWSRVYNLRDSTRRKKQMAGHLDYLKWLNRG